MHFDFFIDDVQLDHVFKQTGWKVKTNAHVNLTYPSGGKTIKSLSFVMLAVFQVRRSFFK